MKSYKEFIKESTSSIESICKKYGIRNYTINPDGSIDVDDNVYLNSESLTKLPLKFRNVGGIFDCNYNKLTTLEGAPQSVGGSFYCSNNQLTTLEGAPQRVGGSFDCRNNQLVDFNGFPEDFEGIFYCVGNPVFEIYNLFNTVKCIYWLNEFDVIQGNEVILDRLEDVYAELGMDFLIFKNYKLK